MESNKTKKEMENMNLTKNMGKRDQSYIIRLETEMKK